MAQAQLTAAGANHRRPARCTSLDPVLSQALNRLSFATTRLVDNIELMMRRREEEVVVKPDESQSGGGGAAGGGDVDMAIREFIEQAAAAAGKCIYCKRQDYLV